MNQLIESEMENCKAFGHMSLLTFLLGDSVLFYFCCLWGLGADDVAGLKSATDASHQTY